jgi:hypothetical protein
MNHPELTETLIVLTNPRVGELLLGRKSFL